MKERPILFSGPMVRAILEGRKTVTRRVVKPQPDFLGSMTDPTTPFKTLGAGLHGQIVCPYGQTGERLWVRETCRAEELISGEDGVRYLADDAWMMIKDDSRAAIDWLRLYNYAQDKGRMVPSIHMPRWASRILLEITAVRVERLQDISGDQAEAEGVDAALCRQFLETSPSRHECKEAVIHGFAGLWASINGNGSWDANPWVWVVEFKRVGAGE